MIKQITPHELKERLDKGEQFEIIDVRQPYEYDICHLEESKLIPLNEIPFSVDMIEGKLPVIVNCHHGTRSQMAIQLLQHQLPHLQLLNLQGGIHAWAVEIDPDMPKY